MMGHPTIPCPCGLTAHPQPLFPASPLAFPPPPPRCPATTRHTEPHDFREMGLQCKYEPGHEGDHAAYVAFGRGDVFWPQEAAEPVLTGETP